MNTDQANVIDLRSDTLTLPSEEMLDAMRNAELGDDCYGEDPTVNRLQDMAAERMGKDAGLLVASGTMGSLCAVLALTTPGQEVILGDNAHQYLWEVGGISRIANCVTHPVPFHDGMLDPDEIEAAIRPDDIHAAQTGLICVENTSNLGGGIIIPPEHLARIRAVADRHGLPIHMDGARVWNAAIGLGVDISEIVQYVDTVTFCLSKGLSCPVGSVVVGDREVIERADQARKLLGGAMRQAGVIAAAGIVALEKGIDRLAEDHANARKLGEGIERRVPGSVNLEKVQTNMVYVNTAAFNQTGQEFADRMAAYGVKFLPLDGSHQVRMVAHRMIRSEDIDYVLRVFERMLEDL